MKNRRAIASKAASRSQPVSRYEKKAPSPIKDNDDREHALLPPSASSRWIACPPSMAYVAMLVEAKHIKKRVSGDAARRGTRIHKWGEQFIKWIIDGKKTTSVEGDKTELEEAREYAKFCVKQLNDERDVVSNDVRYGVEDKAIVDEDYCWGSRDFWFFSAGTLTVMDLKTGREPVVIKGNTQLLIYAMDKFYELAPEFVRLLIFQPNSDEGGEADREYVYTADEMSAHARKINGYIEKARSWFGRKSYRDLEDNLVAGDHCGWCDALGVCPKARAFNAKVSKGAFNVVGDTRDKRR